MTEEPSLIHNKSTAPIESDLKIPYFLVYGTLCFELDCQPLSVRFNHFCNCIVFVTMVGLAAVWKVPIEFCVDVCLPKTLAVSVYALMQCIEISSGPFIPVWAGLLSFSPANWTEFVYQAHRIFRYFSEEKVGLSFLSTILTQGFLGYGAVATYVILLQSLNSSVIAYWFPLMRNPAGGMSKA